MFPRLPDRPGGLRPSKLPRGSTCRIGRLKLGGGAERGRGSTGSAAPSVMILATWTISHDLGRSEARLSIVRGHVAKGTRAMTEMQSGRKDRCERDRLPHPL